MYRLANLFSWKDRSFDLSDEGCWLDLLDDFGPALPRFLLDDSCAASIPEGDEALDELRQSLVKQPIASLKPEVGSVWILFAFKEDLASLPAPFRRDGILLPFEWRADEGRHGELLPDGLVQLAERVKGQFGTDAAGYTLHPSRHFLDTVDFKIPGATFDSAWGALATGLHLLLSGKKNLTAWPFSTIAYDFASDAPAAVGELAHKFLLAASAGAEEIAVAPVQYREAKKVLAEQQHEHPDNKALKRLKIYHWNSSGEFRRSVARLAKCNQGTKRKRIIVESALAMCTCALVLATCASVYVYDWKREKIAYFRDYADRFGVPHGLFALQKEDIGSRSRSYRFHFQGYDGYLPWRRKPVLRSLCCVNSHDRPVKDTSTLPLHPETAGRRFVYGESGRLVEIRCFRPNGYETAIFRLSGVADEFVDVTRRGHDGQWGTIEWGLGEIAKGNRNDKVRRIAVQRDADGFVRQISYLKDSKGTPTTWHGVGKECYELDTLGRVVTKRTYTCDGRQSVGEGAPGDEFRYSFSEVGDLESITVLQNGKTVTEMKCDIGIKDKPGSSNKKYGEYGELIEERLVGKDGSVDYIVRYQYDTTLSYRTETAFFDSTGNPTKNAEGWSVHTVEYKLDRASGGSCRTDKWFDGMRRPVNIKTGCAKAMTTFDANGRCTKLELYGEDGEKIRGRDGYHCAKYDYDLFGYRSGASHFGVEGEPVIAKCEDTYCHAVRLVNDESGNILEATMFGVDGKPMNSPPAGYSKEVRRYDNAGREIECAFFDVNGNRVAPDGYKYCRVETRYADETGGKEQLRYGVDGTYLKTYVDAHGNLLRESYHNADDSLRHDERGIAQVAFKYDEKNREIKRGFLDTNGQRTLSSEGIAGWESTYDANGDKTEERYFGRDGETCGGNNGIAIIRWRYDEAHHPVAKDFLDANGKPTSNNDGDYGERWEYDERGNQIASYSIDGTGKAKPDASGVGISRYEYDAKGRIIKRRFFGVDGKPIKSKEGIGGWLSEYDDAGNETCRMFFDEHEKPCMYEGRGGWRMRFDEHGRVIEEESLDCRGNVTPQKLSIGGIEMKLGKAVYFYGRDGRKTVVGEAFKGEQILGEVKKARVYYTRDGDMERIEFMDETNKLVTSSLLGYARKEIKYNEFREVTEESWWTAEGDPATFLPDMVHRTEIHCSRMENGLTLTVHNYDVNGFHVVNKASGFARQVIRYDSQGRLLSRETFDEHNNPTVCGKCSKVFVEYDSAGKTKTILMQGVGDNGDIEKFKIEIVGREAQFFRLNSKNEVMDTRSRKLEDMPKEFLNLGRMRYSVDSNRRPTQIIVPIE